MFSIEARVVGLSPKGIRLRARDLGNGFSTRLPEETYPDKITEWKAADKKARIAHFGPGFIRNALDKRDGFSSGARKHIYDLLSERASHASYPGFSLVTNAQNLGQIGPFFDEKKLAACLTELATRLMHASMHLIADHRGADLKLLATRAHYLDVTSAWRDKYLPSK